MLDDPIGHDRLHDALHLGIAQLGLGLALELRVGQLHGDDGGQAFADVVSGEVRLFLRESSRAACPIVERAREGSAEARHVRAPVDRVDVVGEGEHVLGEAIVVLESDLDAGSVHYALNVDGPRIQRFTSPVQVAHERGDTALEVEVLLSIHALVAEPDPEALIEVGGLAQAGGDQLPGEIEHVEDLWIGPKDRARPARATPRRVEPAVRLFGTACLADRRSRIAANVVLHPAFVLAQNLHTHLG